MKKEYTHTGQCIWCLKKKPEVTFYNRPHTISKQIGAENIGVDICDSCNTYFGTVDQDKPYPMSVELAFKEVFNLTRYLLSDFTKPQKKRLSSTYFNIWLKERRLEVKRTFKYRPSFLLQLTRQFKRGVYEVFLQEYHRETKEALDSKFNRIRNYARFDVGEVPLYFLENNGVLLVPENIEHPSFSFNDHVKDTINDLGFYSFMLFGHWLFLEVTPRAELSRHVHLNNLARQLVGSGFVNRSIREMTLVTELDFSLRNLK
ncbi:MAG: HNH endonuclease [Carboxylicivirga sp.]|jgi:hypothetical protein|nr:HNH endonuclease [Carboxylicivirga sp.]